jgi:hypothetical protein
MFTSFHAASSELETAWFGVLFYNHAAPKGAKVHPSGVIQKQRAKSL